MLHEDLTVGITLTQDDLDDLDYQLQERYDDGHTDGHDVGWQEGYDSGHQDGWQAGYEEALEEARNSLDHI